MYGILAACIAVMAMFLGLFALSVEPETKTRQDKLTMQTVQAPLNQVGAER
jgi:uncharacterized membrane protein